MSQNCARMRFYYMRRYEYSIFVVSYQSISQIKLVSTPEKTLLFCKVINVFAFWVYYYVSSWGRKSRYFNNNAVAVVGSCCV
jgi:hypothetical protein